MDEFDNRLHHTDIRQEKIEKDFAENILKVRTDLEREIEKVTTSEGMYGYDSE